MTQTVQVKTNIGTLGAKRRGGSALVIGLEEEAYALIKAAALAQEVSITSLASAIIIKALANGKTDQDYSS